MIRKVNGVFFNTYNRLGYGLPESVYSRAMEVGLVREGLHVAREASIEVSLDGEVLGQFKADMIVEDRVILEFKAGPRLVEADFLQLMSYLKASHLEFGLLMHFGPSPKVRRVFRPR